ncbi:flagellar basal-body rod protein FlgG [Bacillus safensis FO-36b] [Bacillus safensis subsp. safensis]
MLRSLYSGISGMKNFQSKLDVVANNVANVNTHGYKKSRHHSLKIWSAKPCSSSGGPYEQLLVHINSKQIGFEVIIFIFY